MANVVNLNGVQITFPFKPYQVQEDYMSKVIECLQNSQHGVLESPTGTGKTLSLLCSTLSWLLVKKAQLQAQAAIGAIEKPDFGGEFFSELKSNLDKAGGIQPDQAKSNVGWMMPRIIYASRTHSQISQAMQELKRTTYKHVSVAVLGSRDQLCIHPEVSKEQNSFHKIQMCQAKVKARTCYYYNNVEVRKDDPLLKQNILDIEDLVKAGQKLKCCPYFLSRELKQNADIVFMPYNYLLDPKSRKSQGIDLQNNVVLLDEAHNVEKMCEEASSLQISSTDIAVCIEEVTAVMKDMANELDDQTDFSLESTSAVQKDFTAEDLCILKTMFLELEKAIDSIEIKNATEGETFPGGYIFELLEKAQITHGKEQLVVDKLDKIILYLSTINTSAFTRRGNALQKFSDLLRIVFIGGVRHKEKIRESYKVHIQFEDQKQGSKNDGWKVKKPKTNEGKLISYWCFSPGFGMQQLVEQGVRSIILTSGTLSPLKPFISEIGIPINVTLENPHIVNGEQLCVGILSKGPDGHVLNSSFNTRNDPLYIGSLGRTVLNFSNIIPHGLLIFFPSYPILNKCKEDWQNSGLWTKITSRKSIFVEPQTKQNFANIMNEFYEKIKDPTCRGAIFMAVCRGKVSEGLDFANSNGRAVLITGLPFPPYKDPRVILKRRYLDENYAKKKEGLTGQYWYQLEALRAVNQAIGRIIRHKDDYGAIILCDCRFENTSNKQQLSTWIRPHIKMFTNFAIVTKELRDFFAYTRKMFSEPTSEISTIKDDDFSLPPVAAEFDISGTRQLGTCSKKIVTTSKLNDTLDLKLYMKNTDNIKSNTSSDIVKSSNAKKSTTESDDLFDILKETKSKSRINFNSCDLTEYQNMRNTKRSPEELQPKRKKFKMVSVDVNNDEPLPSTSTSLSLENGENLINSQNNQTNVKVSTSGDRKELGKVYLKEVKKALSDENYSVFRKMLVKYTSTSNFEELLETLKFLFCRNDATFHLFSGFRSFIKKEHQSSFDSHISLTRKSS